MSGKKGLILDRDGTLIDTCRDEETGTVFTAFHPKHLRLLPRVVEGLRLAIDHGYVLSIATNQPAPAKGYASAAAITKTNDALVAMLRERGVEIAAVECCFHHPEGGEGGDASLVGPCACRKPLPGMLLTLMQKLSLDVGQTWMVGDTATDVQAGLAAQVRTALVFPEGRCELCPLRNGPKIQPDLHAPTLDALVAAIVARDEGLAVRR